MVRGRRTGPGPRGAAAKIAERSQTLQEMQQQQQHKPDVAVARILGDLQWTGCFVSMLLQAGASVASAS